MHATYHCVSWFPYLLNLNHAIFSDYLLLLNLIDCLTDWLILYRVSCSTGWFQTCCIVEDKLGFLILLLLPQRC